MALKDWTKTGQHEVAGFNGKGGQKGTGGKGFGDRAVDAEARRYRSSRQTRVRNDNGKLTPIDYRH